MTQFSSLPCTSSLSLRFSWRRTPVGRHKAIPIAFSSIKTFASRPTKESATSPASSARFTFADRYRATSPSSAAALFLEQGTLITGDVRVVGGNARAENGTQVAGDLTVIGGTLLRDPQASVAGDVTTLGGGGWVFLIFLLPFAILGGIIALIVWLNQRSRRPAPVPAYTLRGTDPPVCVDAGDSPALSDCGPSLKRPKGLEPGVRCRPPAFAGEIARDHTWPLTLPAPSRRSPARCRTSHPVRSPAPPETRTAESARSASP